MGKARKKKHTFQYEKNRKKAWKKSKKQVTIECEQIKDAWDYRKSVAKNMSDMGLSTNANKTLAIPKAKDMGKKKQEKMSIDEAKKVAKKQFVVEELVEEAALPEKKTLTLSEPLVQFCVYMMEKYGEDYTKMARDRRNHYQETPNQIKKKIKTFKNIPEQYEKYLKSKTTPMDH